MNPSHILKNDIKTTSKYLTRKKKNGWNNSMKFQLKKYIKTKKKRKNDIHGKCRHMERYNKRPFKQKKR